MNNQTDWAAHVAAWRNSGKTASAYCAAHGLKMGALRYWSVQLDKAQGASEVGYPMQSSIRLAQVRRPSPVRTASGAAFSLSVGEVTLQVPPGTDVAALRETVKMVLELVGGQP